MENIGDPFRKLVDVMRALRGDNGCPWDKEQTLESLKTYVIEEAYEVVEAIEKRDFRSLKEELGDLLLQIVFQARIAEEEGHFSIDEVCSGVAEKVIRRHPHVFGEVKVRDSQEVLARWEGFKEKEGRGLLDGIPISMPALLMAMRISDKVGHVGFDWPDASSVLEKLDEEVAELKEAIGSGELVKIEEEIGDLLFTVANLARKHGLNPEESLRKMCMRFKQRFSFIEKTLKAEGKALEETPLKRLDEIWEQSKSHQG